MVISAKQMEAITLVMYPSLQTATSETTLMMAPIQSHPSCLQNINVYAKSINLNKNWVLRKRRIIDTSLCANVEAPIPKALGRGRGWGWNESCPTIKTLPQSDNTPPHHRSQPLLKTQHRLDHTRRRVQPGREFAHNALRRRPMADPGRQVDAARTQRLEDPLEVGRRRVAAGE